MSTHFKNTKDNRTTANLKNVFITANWKPRKANKTCGWAQPLHSGDTQRGKFHRQGGDTGRRNRTDTLETQNVLDADSLKGVLLWMLLPMAAQQLC